jgi:hypothetical protein
VNTVDVVTHVIFSGERPLCALTCWHGAVVLLSLVQAMCFFLMAGQDGLGGESNTFAFRLTANIGAESGLEVFATNC